METWKAIPGFDDYEASTAGRIRSLNPRKGSRGKVNGGIIGGWTQTVKPGYVRQCVALRKDNKTFIKKVHRVILETFAGPCPPGMEVLHKNGKALDNRLENLRWGTHAENVADSTKHGTKKPPPKHYGEKHHRVTIPSEGVAYIRSLPYEFGLYARLAKQFGVADVTITRIRRGDTRTKG